MGKCGSKKHHVAVCGLLYDRSNFLGSLFAMEWDKLKIVLFKIHFNVVCAVHLLMISL